MPKIECENCGRKTTVGREREPPVAEKQYCGRCGEKLPPAPE